MRDRLAEHVWKLRHRLTDSPQRPAGGFVSGASYDINGAINLHLDDEEVHPRVLGRRLCSPLRAATAAIEPVIPPTTHDVITAGSALRGIRPSRPA